MGRSHRRPRLIRQLRDHSLQRLPFQQRVRARRVSLGLEAIFSSRGWYGFGIVFGRCFSWYFTPFFFVLWFPMLSVFASLYILYCSFFQIFPHFFFLFPIPTLGSSAQTLHIHNVFHIHHYSPPSIYPLLTCARLGTHLLTAIIIILISLSIYHP